MAPKSFFTGDWHLFHKNIIKHAKRPFADTGEMGRVIQDNINAVVTERDWLYILGDIAFGRPEWLAHWLDGLRCKNLCVIWGNHDVTAKRLALAQPRRFYWTERLNEIKIDGTELTLCHYAMRVWNKSHYGTYQLYGHSHGRLPDDPHARSIDVGVDCHGFKPISLDQIHAIMAKKQWKPVDHHRGTAVERTDYDNDSSP